VLPKEVDLNMASRLVLRITLPLLLLSLLLLVVGGSAAWYIFRQQEKLSRELAQTIEAGEVAESLEDEVDRIRSHLRSAESGDVVSPGRASPDQLLAFLGDLEIALERTESIVADGDHVQTVITIRRQCRIFNDSIEQFLSATPNASRRLPPEVIQHQPRADVLMSLAKEIQGAQSAELRRVMAETQRWSSYMVMAMLLAGVFGAASGVLAGIAVVRLLRQSMMELSLPVYTAAGALNSVVGPVRLPVNGTYGQLRQTLDGLAGQVKDTVEQLQSTQQKSLRSEQLAAVGQLAAGLAHEIRNPLTSMKSLIQLARQDGGPENLSQRDLQVLDEEISRLDRQVQTFLDFARPPRPRRELIDVVELINKTIQLSQTRARQQDATITPQVAVDSIEIEADPDLLQQVLLNLVLNALEVLSGGGTVEIAAEQSVAGDDVVIRVLDDGPGVPEDAQEKIFEPFFSTQESGTGIGLAICRRIVEQHDGTITVRNRDTGGAEFTVTLPCKPSSEEGSLLPTA